VSIEVATFGTFVNLIAKVLFTSNRILRCVNSLRVSHKRTLISYMPPYIHNQTAHKEHEINRTVNCTRI
jgi:hypothetical protein